MNEEQPKVQVQIPEKEANELASALRHTKALKGVGLSVYAYVSRSGTRALHVAADKDLGNGNYQRYDIQYKADKDISLIARNAIKRIRAEFDM